VHGVSAPEYKKLLVDDEEERPKIKDADESGIPGLAAALERLATDLEANLLVRIEEARRRLGERVATTLDLLRSQWERDDREPEEVKRLQSDLDELLPNLRRELHARQGAYREFLSESLPSRIDQLVDEAKASAEKEIQRYLGALEDVHWATLRAAVRRGGTFLGSRHIDLPNDFAVRIDEPIGLIWSKRILASLRARTSRQALDYAELVGELAEWAGKQGTRVQTKVLRNLVDEIKADSKSLSEVGKEAVEDLRERVRADLLKKIVAPIRKRCSQFVDEQQDRGTGTKRRILELFREVLPTVVEAAGETAKKTLDGNYQTVKREILMVFDKYPDPLDRAKKVLIASEEERARNRDAQQRAEVLALLEMISKAAPIADPVAGESS
jgi:hypothetical protein